MPSPSLSHRYTLVDSKYFYLPDLIAFQLRPDAPSGLHRRSGRSVLSLPFVHGRSRPQYKITNEGKSSYRRWLFLLCTDLFFISWGRNKRLFRVSCLKHRSEYVDMGVNQSYITLYRTIWAVCKNKYNKVYSCISPI